tara:strand:+ start:674 stop:1786 length:1113 start_codon:yes stop_codon:yes gene_type:complete
MSRIRVASVVGARPQFMKASVLSKEFLRRSNFEEILIHSGQHFDHNMSSKIIDELFDKKFDFILSAGNKNEIDMTSYILSNLQKLFKKTKPDAVIVFGDTTTTLASALTARKMNIPIIHAESGVRNYDNYMPEEINRILVDRISTINICATSVGKNNLEKEGFGTDVIESKIKICGDLMYDAYLETINNFRSEFSPLIKEHKLSEGKFILCTIHRSSNVDNLKTLKNIVTALNDINKFIPIIFPVHPRTKQKLLDFKLKLECITIDPITYKETIHLLKDCNSVITDSGGLVRESYFSKKLSLMLLESPVWPEINKEEASLNIKPEIDLIVQGFKKLQNLKPNYNNKIFGEGKTAGRIVDLIEEQILSTRK